MTDSRLDPHLLAALRAGDDAAFERFFRAWYPGLADYALRILGAPDLAEDAVQEVMVEVWKRREALPDAASLPAWLHRSVRNRALNQLRFRQRVAGGDPEDLPGQQIAPAAPRRLLKAELATALGQAIGDLPPRTREIFILSREQGLTYPAIAETLGISVKTVETLMGRALAALRATLGPRLHEPD